MTPCKVGIFKLPGLTFKQFELSHQLIAEMKEWAAETKCGQYMTDTLWSFRSEKKRDMFILKWSEVVTKENE